VDNEGAAQNVTRIGGVNAAPEHRQRDRGTAKYISGEIALQSREKERERGMNNQENPGEPGRTRENPGVKTRLTQGKTSVKVNNKE